MLKRISTQRTLSLMMTFMMLFSIFAVVSANSDEIDPAKIAVYLNSSFDGDSAIIEGDLYSANGDVKFSSSGSNAVSGKIYLNTEKKFEIGNWLWETFSKKLVRLDNTEFDAPEKIFMTAPQISNYVESFTVDGNSTDEDRTVGQDTHYGTLNIQSCLVVDVKEGDIYIVVDNIVFGDDACIKPEGNGNLFLFIKNSLFIGGSSTIKGKNEHDVKTHVFVSGDVNISTYPADGMHANIYVDGDKRSITVKASAFYGNIVSNTAKSFNIPGGSKVYGTVYVPGADASIVSGGHLTGRIVTNTLKLHGMGKVTYDPIYSNLTMPQSAVPEECTLTVIVNPATGGVVNPSSITVNRGETVTLQVTANEGYQFVGFTSADGNNLPDENGNITVTEDIELTANFELAPMPTPTPTPTPTMAPPPMDIPEGDPLVYPEIEFPYAYLYGSEDGYVYPERNVTREEVAAVIYRLLKQAGKLDKGFSVGIHTYENIEPHRWSRAALEYMKHIGVYTTSYISAEAPIPRGEVAKIICFALRIRPDDSKSLPEYPDFKPDNQYYHYIKALVDKKFLYGDRDGKMRPNDPIVRAEFVTMVNRIIYRDDSYPVKDDLNPYLDLRKMVKNDKDEEEVVWYYNDIMRASFAYIKDDNGGYKIDENGKPDRYSIDYN